MKFLIPSLAIASSMFIGNVALAGTHDPGINSRQTHQRQRIVQGVRSGELTWHEATVISNGQRHVNRLEHRYKADGTLTNKERARLQGALNIQSHRIYNQKHDRQSY
jgi:hypothetical protein